MTEYERPEENALLTPVDLATRWHCAVGHLANLRSAGVGPTYVKLGAKVLYRYADVLDYEDEHVVRIGS